MKAQTHRVTEQGEGEQLTLLSNAFLKAVPFKTQRMKSNFLQTKNFFFLSPKNKGKTTVLKMEFAFFFYQNIFSLTDLKKKKKKSESNPHRMNKELRSPNLFLRTSKSLSKNTKHDPLPPPQQTFPSFFSNFSSHSVLRLRAKDSIWENF